MSQLNALRNLIHESLNEIQSENEANYPTSEIEARLNALRSSLVYSGKNTSVSNNYENLGDQRKQSERLDIKTVSDLIGVPLDVLMLYFLNNVKASNERHAVEYRMGTVFFYL